MDDVQGALQTVPLAPVHATKLVGFGPEVFTYLGLVVDHSDLPPPGVLECVTAIRGEITPLVAHVIVAAYYIKLDGFCKCAIALGLSGLLGTLDMPTQAHQVLAC